MITFAALAVSLLGYVVMSIWNAVLPAVTGLHSISFVQALGLLVLSRILFGGLRGWDVAADIGERGCTRAGNQMSPEERERFREVLGSRGCGRNDASARSSQVG